MKKKWIAPVIGGMVLLLSACQKNPDSSIVKNKDLDNMIEQAGDSKNGSADLGELKGEYNEYKASLSDDSLHVTVNVDAKVEIPGSSQMSVFRVRQKEIGQDFLDRVKKELMQGTVLYDGSVTWMKTRSSIEKEIQSWKEEKARLKSDSASYDKESMQTMLDEYQQMIDNLQKEYENAPADITWEEYPSDGKIDSVEKICKKYPQRDFYAWVKELNPNGSVYYGVSDGKDGKYAALYAQNNENYGNSLRYSCNRNEFVKITSAVAGDHCNVGMWRIEDGVSQDNLLFDAKPEDLTECTDVSSTMTKQEAQNEADELIRSLGLTDFQCYSGDLYGEIVQQEVNHDGKWEYRKVYILNYLRNIDGVFVDNGSSSKFTDEWQGSEYVKREWPGENIEIIINDDGVVGFYYSAPIEVMETVVDQSNLKSFDEIKNIFEQMILVTNAKKEKDEAVSINVSKVILRYTRISEKDSFDTGLLVPVWDFMGTIEYQYGERTDWQETCVMTINAIDGSVIDRELGY